MNGNPYGMRWIYGKTKGIRGQLALYAAIALCIPVVQLLFSFFLKQFIDIATGDLQMPLADVAVRTAATVGAGGVLMMAGAVLTKWIYGKIECNFRAEILETIFSRRMIELSKQHTGELLTKLTADVQAVSGCFTAVMDNILGASVSALLATAALFFLNWKIAVILLVLIPLLMFATGAVTPHIQKASVKDKGNEEINRSRLQENLSRIILIKTYCMQSKTVQKVKSIYGKKLKSGIEVGKWEGIAAFAGSLFGNMMSIVTLGLGAYFVLRGETTVGSLIMIVQLLNYIVTPISSLPAAIAQVGQAAASANRIGTIYELPADRETAAAPPVNAAELLVKNVRFAYGGENGGDGREYLLDNIQMSFPKGRVVGIVGKSGSGKSTLLKLIMGLYTPQTGTVELKHASGVLSGEEIMAEAAYVPPMDYLFSGSVSDNIVMSDTQPRYDDMQAAASEANIRDFIRTLPHGFDTQLGESGGTVSSGQAQRIAIARAIYKKAQVVVFDEPTANLDADSIEKFQSAVRLLAQDKICIIVTHDASAMTVCDKIYVLENGGVRENAVFTPEPSTV